MLVAQAPSLPTAAPASPAAEPFAVETNADRLSATLESLQRSERGTTPAAEEAPGAAPARAAQSLLEQIAASAAANRDTAFVRSDLVGGAPSPPASQAVPAAQPQPPAAPAPVPTLGNGAANLTAHTAPAAEAAGIMARNAEFDDDRRQKVSNPDLRIELSYVTARDQVAGRVEHLRTFFPEVMLRKGRFFGATIPSSPGVFIVGIEARDIASRDDLVWYMERMEIPWAMRR